jgi:hypothetical protein
MRFSHHTNHAMLLLRMAVLLAPMSMPAADTGGLFFSISNSWNRVFDPAPGIIQGVSDYQARSVQIFTGNAGPIGHTNTPND